MKQIYDLAGLMRKLNVYSFGELQDLGFDVRGYLERQEKNLAEELEAIRYGIQELDAWDEKLEHTPQDMDDERYVPYDNYDSYADSDDLAEASSQANDHDDNAVDAESNDNDAEDEDEDEDEDDDLPSYFTFDSALIGKSNYIYIGT